MGLQPQKSEDHVLRISDEDEEELPQIVEDIQADVTQDITPSEDSPSLNDILADAQRSHDRLISDIEYLDKRAQTIIQINLVIIGILASTGASVLLSVPNTEPMKVGIGASIALLIISVVLSLRSQNLPGTLYQGTIFPHVLQSMIVHSPIDVKKLLLDNLSRSYYANYEQYLKRGAALAPAGFLQFAGFTVLAVSLLAIIVKAILG